MRKLLILLLVPLKLFALNETVDNSSLYNRALGGPHSGMVNGFDTFFNNPALLVEYEEEFSIMSLDLNLKGDALDLLNLYLADALPIDDVAAMVTELESKGLTSLLIGLDLPGPITLGYLGNNWGWSLRNSSNVYVKLPGLLSEATIIGREDLTFSVGIAIPFRMSFSENFFLEISPGVMSRTTLRAEVLVESTLSGFMDYTDDFTKILDDYPLNFSPMFAVDLGGNININNIVRITGVIKDLYTPILKYPVESFDDAIAKLTSSDETLGTLAYREVNTGLAFDIPLGPLTILISDLDIYLDYFDIMDSSKNIWLHFGVGMDLELLEKFHLLAGMNEGLFSLGVDVDLGGFNVGFAMYGTEESTQPGVLPTFNFLISMGISI